LYFCVDVSLPDYIYRIVGESVTFPCTAPESTKTTDWFFSQIVTQGPAKQIISAGLPVNGYRDDKRFALSDTHGSNDASLHISNLISSDSGLYICRTLLNGRYVQQQFQLTVQRKDFACISILNFNSFYVFWLWKCWRYGRTCNSSNRSSCII